MKEVSRDMVPVMELAKGDSPQPRPQRGMARLVDAVQDLSRARNLATVMLILRRAARELTGADGASFVLRDGNFCHYADEDAIAPLWKGQRFPMHACVSGWVMLNGKTAVIDDIYSDPRVPADAYRPTFVKSLVMVPVRTEAPIAAIGNYWAEHHMPTAEEVHLLEALANTASVAMENVRVYDELEQRVKDRTAELETAQDKLVNANRELESFAYSVCHDLSAPMRSIKGFAEMAMADCSEQGKKHLLTVQNSADEMRDLMDNLLRLSMSTISEMKKETVNLSTLAQNIVDHLKSSSPNRTVDCYIAPGIEVDGDIGLLRVALENLFGNAWKYTSKRNDARIELTRIRQTDGSHAYCVRDNGSGFDMKLAGQLFQPFKRLHSTRDFPGTGIGLTTVQRIIHRHGGQIWAHSEPGAGAEFFFTLP